MPLASPCMQNIQQRNIWNELFRSSERQLDTRSVLGGIDVNRAPATTECEEEEAERPSCSPSSDDEDGGGGDDDASRRSLGFQRNSRWCLKKPSRNTAPLIQLKQKLALAMKLNLRPRQVEVWFQNRRARTKLKRTEADYFINQTVLNKFWELLHLLFIGIAVSYGLFGRRSNADNVSHEYSHSYASGISHFSSVFEDDFDHSICYSVHGKAGSFNVKNGSFESPYVENVVQAWSSKCVLGEHMVVLARPHCELVSFVDHKPLGLPVRSLKGVEFGTGSSEFSGTNVVDSSDSSDKSEGESSSDLGSESLEGKYNENDVLDSPIPWRSRSVRMLQRVGGGGATRAFILGLSQLMKLNFNHSNHVGFKRQYLGGNSSMQNPTFSKNQNREQRECSESEKDDEDFRVSSDEDFRVSSDEETISGTLSVAGSDSYVVDRKAGEFIAKFREQVRLQRTTSIDSLKGLKPSGNFFR
ncbi:Phosphotyrosine protein phosphatases superfamily protein [Hibiscus syriacus]|uniref:Phosphotyrosine protein phosphatases superfamily protein n=1 Tax=Hibiscus syriacus TaxID=106335 RepID=A0A6A2ZSC9_HIBSY|nr:Phosphotyrosine protein phosphatases superfamily protein [Hibiscus syriacus]